MMTLLQQRNVDAIDLRETMYNSRQPIDKLFFKTDHHWTPLAAFYAYKDIIKEMNRLYGTDLDPDGYYTDISNYNSHTYEKAFLGTMGENTGAVYSGLEAEIIVINDIAIETYPAYDDGTPNATCIVGQPEPRSESGSPRLINIRYITASNREYMVYSPPLHLYRIISSISCLHIEQNHI